MAITVDPAAGVLVTAPVHVSVTRLDQVVRRKAVWIIQALRRRGSPSVPLSPREFVSGETFRYLGRQYRLKVRKGPAQAVRLTGGWLTLELPKRPTKERVKGALVDWYRAHARQRLAERVAFWSSRLGIPAPDLLIREPRRRWASCDSKGVLRFNWRIIQAPMPLVDYVVAHELVHLDYPNHTPAFWKKVGGVLPDYDKRREVLRRFGPFLEW